MCFLSAQSKVSSSNLNFRKRHCVCVSGVYMEGAAGLGHTSAQSETLLALCCANVSVCSSSKAVHNRYFSGSLDLPLDPLRHELESFAWCDPHQLRMCIPGLKQDIHSLIQQPF